MVYYNEHDPKLAPWLYELMAAGQIAPGYVDTRSIEDVAPDDLREFKQCHFFAGIGGWSYALRLAGWPDDRPVWTGSCPCQPFSAAGKGGGFDDPRHLWPAWHWLIAQRRPGVVFGEQVASRDGLAWLDLVQADMEATGYAVGAVDLCAAGVGAPHIRQRLWFVADTDGGYAGSERQQRGGEQRLATQDGGPRGGLVERPVHGGTGVVADANSLGRTGLGGGGQNGTPERGEAGRTVADADGGYAGSERQQRGGEQRLATQDGGVVGRLADTDLRRALGDDEGRQPGQSRERGSPWSTAEWVQCRDGKARPTKPGIFPLAHGVPGRVGLLRGAGNAIVPAVGQAVVEAYLEITQ